MENNVKIEMRCSCKATFSLDVPYQVYSNYNCRDLALAWNAAHSGHHKASVEVKETKRVRPKASRTH